MFTTNHYIWLAICVVLIGGLIFLSKKFKFSLKTATFIMLGIAFASEFIKIFTHIKFYEISIGEGFKTSGWYLLPKSLPLHLCSILVFVIIYLAFGKNESLKQKMMDFFVPIGLFGGFLALMLATSGVDFKDPSSYQSFIYHAGILWYSIFLLMNKHVFLGLKQFIRNIIVLGSLAIIMIWVNSFLVGYGTNFFFIVEPPAKGLPLLNLNHGWHAYFAHLCFCGLLLEFLCALPGIIIERKK